MSDAERRRITALTVLGLDAGATPAEVTSAYRRLARTLHPDLSPNHDAAARFAALTEAYRHARRPAPAPASVPTGRRTGASVPVHLDIEPGLDLRAAPPPAAGVRSAPVLIVGPVHVTPPVAELRADARSSSATAYPSTLVSWLGWE